MNVLLSLLQSRGEKEVLVSHCLLSLYVIILVGLIVLCFSVEKKFVRHTDCGPCLKIVCL